MVMPDQEAIALEATRMWSTYARLRGSNPERAEAYFLMAQTLDAMLPHDGDMDDDDDDYIHCGHVPTCDVMVYVHDQRDPEHPRCTEHATHWWGDRYAPRPPLKLTDDPALNGAWDDAGEPEPDAPL